MDKGEIEVEERRVRMKRVLVFPTDREKYDSENMHVASRSQSKTEDPRKHLEIEFSLPRVGMDRGFLCSKYGRGSNHELNVDTEASQRGKHPSGVPRRPKASCGQLSAGKPWREWLGQSVAPMSVESDAQTFVDPDWVGRVERMMAEKSPKFR